MLSIFLSKAFGYIGIWYAAPIGWVLGIIPSAIRYHSGAWRTDKGTGELSVIPIHEQQCTH